MESQAQRYSLIRKQSGLTQQSFARSLSISQSYSSLIESGSRTAGRDVIERLASLYNVDVHWFLTGEVRTGSSVNDGRVNDGSFSSGSGISSQRETDAGISIPFIQQEAAAGRGTDIEDFSAAASLRVPHQLLAGRSPKYLAAVPVRGDSMKDSGISDKDVVVFDRSRTDGDCICVVSAGGQLLVKYVQCDAITGRITLISSNELFPPRILEGPEADSVKIEGRVVLCLHQM